MSEKAVVFDLETLSPQKGPEIGKDVITAIGLSGHEDLWAVPIRPGTTSDLLSEEGDLIYDFCQELKKRKPDTLVGYNILGFDLPHLQLRTRKIGFEYQKRSELFEGGPRDLSWEVMTVLSGLKYVDLFVGAIEYMHGRWPKFEEYYSALTNKPQRTEDSDFHVKASAQAILGNPEILLTHLRSDLTRTFEVYSVTKAED